MKRAKEAQEKREREKEEKLARKKVLVDMNNGMRDIADVVTVILLFISIKSRNCCAFVYRMSCTSQ